MSKISVIKGCIGAAVDAKEAGEPFTPFIWGSAGVGKSDAVAQVARDRSMGFIDIRLSVKDPVDLMGLPSTVNGTTIWNKPSDLPQVERDGAKGLLFLDEFNQCAPAVLNATFPLVQSGKIGLYTLPPGWIVIAAGNGKKDGAFISKMPSPLANRFVHLYAEVDNKEWEAWAVDKGIRPEVLAFLRFRPELLHAFDKSADAFPTPRSWEFASRIMGTASPLEIQSTLIQGAVGIGASAEFNSFLSIWKSLPNYRDIFDDPEGAPVPDKAAVLYAISGCLSRRVERETFPNMIAYMKRLPDEFGIMGITDVVKRNPALASCAEYISWEVAHANLTT